MGNKPIEFAEFSQVACGNSTVRVHAMMNGIELWWNSTPVSTYRDPAKLDALAQAITDAAAALRRSQITTLGDLKECDLFRFTDEHPENVRVITSSMDKSNTFVRVVERPSYSAWVNEITESKPVQRITATFTPADEVVK